MKRKKAKKLADIDDEELLEKTVSGLDATKLIRLNSGEFFEVSDHATRLKYLELVYRLKGKLPYNPSHDPNVNSNDMKIEFKY